jgi:hypothetical protein
MGDVIKFPDMKKSEWYYPGEACVTITAADNKDLTVLEAVYLLEATKHNLLTMMNKIED